MALKSSMSCSQTLILTILSTELPESSSTPPEIIKGDFLQASAAFHMVRTVACLISRRLFDGEEYQPWHNGCRAGESVNGPTILVGQAHCCAASEETRR